jgi:hypothetical protein
MLEYPPDFYSTTTYQSGSYSFPHGTIMLLPHDKLRNLFYGIEYVIPKYIYHSNPNFKGDPKIIIDLLKTNDDFSDMGCAFMRLKGLIENIDRNVFVDALNLIKRTGGQNLNPKLRDAVLTYISEEYFNFINIVPHIIIDVIQNIIIHIIRYVSINLKFPNWFNHQNIIYPISELVRLSKKICGDRMQTDIDIAWVYYFSRIMPVLIDMNKYIEIYRNSGVIDVWNK